MLTLFPTPLVNIVDVRVFESKLFFLLIRHDMADKDIILTKCLRFHKELCGCKVKFC